MRGSLHLPVLLLLTGVAVGQEQRVSDGLVVLYTFREGTGMEVGDSGPGEPLNLEIDPFDLDNLVVWNPAGGLSMNLGTGNGQDGGALVRSIDPATKIFDAIAGPNGTNALTLEAWVAPELPDLQVNISRMVTMSLNPTNRNFTLGTTGDGKQYVCRLRTLATGNNATGGPGQLIASGGRAVLAGQLQHVVFTRDAMGVEKLYVDNRVAGGPRTVDGGDDLSSWDPSYEFGLANELTMNRKFNGDFHLVALYDKALDATEVEQNFQAALTGQRASDGLVILYEFNEGMGTTVSDTGPGDPLNLEIDPVDLGSLVDWIPGGGLSVNLGTGTGQNGGAVVRSFDPATKIFDAVVGPIGTGEYTLEVWVRPELEDLMVNISRMVTYSVNPSNRNFTLGTTVDGDQYVNRLRTFVTGNNGAGGPGQLITSTGTVVAGKQQHVVFTRDAAGEEILYVDNAVRAGPRTVTGPTTPPVGSSRGQAFAQVEDLIADLPPYSGRTAVSEPLTVADYHDTGGDAHFGINNPVPGTAGGNNNDFAIEIVGTLNVLVAGDYTFVYAGDDGGRIQIDFNDGNGLVDVINDTRVLHGQEDWGDLVNFPAAGSYDFRLVAFERGGGATFEWMYAQGDRTFDFTNDQFNLEQFGGTPIGDNVPDPNPGPWYLIGDALPDETNPGSNAIEVAPGAMVTAYHSPMTGPQTELSNWDDTYELGLGNEITMNRKFNGDLHLVAVYSKALSAAEVGQNFRAGPGGPPLPQDIFVRGDADSNGKIELTDGIVTLTFLFVDSNTTPACSDAADTDDDGSLSITDGIRVFQWLFVDPNQAPLPPSPRAGVAVYEKQDCGRDPSDDMLGCEVKAGICQ